MKKVFFSMFAMMAIVAMSACGGGDITGDDGDGCGDGCSGDSGGVDMAEMMMQPYLDGTVKASYWIGIHDDPQAGQYWEKTTTMSGMETVNKWVVAARDGDTCIVENDMGQGYALAYKLDLTAEMGDVNVTEAWIGKLGEKGEAIEVMAKPEPAETGGEAPEYETTTEDFSVDLAGMTWTGTLTTTKGDGWESKVWMADNGWFDKVVKMESGAMVTELTAAGEDAEPLLDWAAE